MTQLSGVSVADQIGPVLPFLRRYARALTGSQSRGDAYAAATLEAIISDTDQYNSDLSPRVALFRTFHGIWATSGNALETDGKNDDLLTRAHAQLARLTPNTREALLLRTVEEFSVSDIATILQIEASEASKLIDIAYDEMAKHMSGRVLIIEDEAIIAMDLESMVAELGHRVVGVARTESAALDLAEREHFDLVLSDIQLADKSSGIDAVNRILETHGDRPVIFITAFPERLLTGKGPEPAFLISKPYTEEQVKSAVSQAMFFASSAMIEV